MQFTFTRSILYALAYGFKPIAAGVDFFSHGIHLRVTSP